MSGRYWVLASDELMGSNPAWPEGLRVVERGPVWVPGMGWWLFEDDTVADDGEPGQGYEIAFTATGETFTWTRSPIPLVALRGFAPPCCSMHNQHCEPPGDLCCGSCTEVHHGGWVDDRGVTRFGHLAGETCSAPFMSFMSVPALGRKQAG